MPSPVDGSDLTPAATLLQGRRATYLRYMSSCNKGVIAGHLNRYKKRQITVERSTGTRR